MTDTDNGIPDGEKPKKKRGRPKAQTRAISIVREERIWDLRAKGWTQTRIAEHLEITQVAVSKAISRISLRRLAEFPEQVDQKRTEQNDRLEYFLSEAAEAWERSKIRWRKRKPTDPAPVGDEDPDWITEPCEGDPKHLETIRGYLADLRKLWGLDAPQKHLVGATTSEGLSPEERQEIWAQLGLTTGSLSTSRGKAKSSVEVQVRHPSEDDILLAGLDHIAESISPSNPEV